MRMARSTYYKRPEPGTALLQAQAEAAMRAAIENVVADWSFGAAGK